MLISMLQTLGESNKCAQLFESLCRRQVTNPQEVIRLLWYETVDGNFIPTNDIVITEDDQSSVKTFFTWYLSGSGHPLHDNFGPDVIGPAVHEHDKDDTLMCSYCLLTMVTGSELLPSNPLQHITVGQLLILSQIVELTIFRFNLFINFPTITFLLLWLQG